jgi:hypothetical protein
MADELSMLLKQAEKPHKESNDFSRIKQEFALFQKTGKRTENLDYFIKLYEALTPHQRIMKELFRLLPIFALK